MRLKLFKVITALAFIVMLGSCGIFKKTVKEKESEKIEVVEKRDSVERKEEVVEEKKEVKEEIKEEEVTEKETTTTKKKVGGKTNIEIPKGTKGEYIFTDSTGRVIKVLLDSLSQIISIDVQEVVEETTTVKEKVTKKKEASKDTKEESKSSKKQEAIVSQDTRREEEHKSSSSESTPSSKGILWVLAIVVGVGGMVYLFFKFNVPTFIKKLIK